MVPVGGRGRALGSKPSGENVSLFLIPEPPKKQEVLALKGRTLVKHKTVFHASSHSDKCIVQHIVMELLREAVRSPRTSKAQPCFLVPEELARLEKTHWLPQGPRGNLSHLQTTLHGPQALQRGRRDFPGGPVAETLSFHCTGHKVHSWSGGVP